MQITKQEASKQTAEFIFFCVFFFFLASALFWDVRPFFRITDLIFMFVLLSQIALSSGPNLHKSLLTSEAPPLWE